MDRNRIDVLHRTIEDQNRKIENYQTKLRDVVQAYKDLSKEKIALEASMNALNLVRPSDEGILVQNRKQSLDGDEETNDESKPKLPTDPLNAESELATGESQDEKEEPVASSSGDGSIQQQVKTLTASLVTLSQQKSKLEASYISEKRKFRQDLDEKEKCHQEETEKLTRQIQTLESEVEQWRNKLRSRQHEQEKEQNDYAVMLRELQTLVNTERMAKENIESQLEDVKMALTEKLQMAQHRLDLHEKTIQDQRQELELVRQQMKAAKEKSSEPSSLVMHLQKELIDFKEQECRMVQQEQLRANNAEEKLHQLLQQSEERIAGLELKVSQYSDMLGSAERIRNQDQQIIQKLREQIIQLDHENNTLTMVAQSKTNNDFDDTEETDVQKIVERITKLSGQLKLANEKTDNPVNLHEILLSGFEDIHQKCQEQYEELREEFERYKLRAQSVLKNKNSKDSGPEKEIVTLKSQVADLRDRLGALRADYEVQEMNLKKKEENFVGVTSTMVENHKMEITQMLADHRQKTAELESEIRRHRERTVVLLAEKDREINDLKVQIPERISDAFYSNVTNQTSNEVGASSAEEASLAATELLLRQTSLGTIPGDTKLLHFAQERGRHEVEIMSLRRQKYSLESALRELQCSMIMKESNHSEQVDMLQEVIKKHERDKSRENANLEYLKNVIYRYMICHDGHGRQQMLNAISTILQFSPAEKQQVQLELSRGWWLPVASPKSPKLK